MRLANAKIVVPQAGRETKQSWNRRGPIAAANADPQFDRDIEEIGKQLSNNQFSYVGRAGYFLRKWATKDGRPTDYAPKSVRAQLLYLHISQLLDHTARKSKKTYQISQVTLGRMLGVTPRSIGTAVKQLTLGRVPLLKVRVGRVGQAQIFEFVEHPGAWRRQMDAHAERTRADRHEQAVRAQAAAEKEFSDDPEGLAAKHRAIAARKNYRQPTLATPSATTPPAAIQTVPPAPSRAVRGQYLSALEFTQASGSPLTVAAAEAKFRAESAARAAALETSKVEARAKLAALPADEVPPEQFDEWMKSLAEVPIPF